MREPKIATPSLPAIDSFAESIDLWDETLREGAERSPLAPSVEEKCALGVALSEIGIRTLVVGMFPDVPHNIELLIALLDHRRDGKIRSDTKFVVISHLGVTLDQTFACLDSLEVPLDPVWILGIHSASDLQIEYLYPMIRKKDLDSDFDTERWADLNIEQRRKENIAWVRGELQRLVTFPGGGTALGMLDAFRAEPSQLLSLAECAQHAGVMYARLVDTAGTCVPHQIDTHVCPMLERFPNMKFFGHFHNDFGLATANAMLGLSVGLTGVDVSIGGFANRAGHPPLAEVVMSLRMLYGIELPDFRFENLCQLSRKAEKVYGLMESPAQPITGVITHGILSGIRTQLIAKAPTIFDVIDPTTVGAQLDRLFGVRSGTDGMRRFLQDNAQELGLSRERIDELTEPMFELVTAEWKARTATCGEDLAETIERYYELLRESAALTEDQMLHLIAERVT